MSSGPEKAEGPDPPKKHPCSDCRHCQWCGDDRCNLCRGRVRARKKLSVEEQIALYESINTLSTRSGCHYDKEKTDR